MQQRVLIKCLWEEGHGSTQIHFQLVEHSGDKAFSYPILMPDIGCGSFSWGEKALKIRNSMENRQISKLVSELREHSKHRPMLAFETLYRLPTLLRQRYSMSSLKFFVWNFVTGDASPEIER
jgi:hypothetical protein